MKYSLVTEKHKKVIILCSGQSLSPLAISKIRNIKIPVISVNGGIEYHDKCDYWVTIDPSITNYRRMQRQLKGVKYYCGVPHDYGKPDNRIKAYRTALGHVHYLRREETFLNGFPEEKDSLISGNSGFAALNLAYHMEAKYVLILGMDGHGKYYNSKSGPRNLNGLDTMFESVLPQLEERKMIVQNGSQISTVECFPKVNSLWGISWLLNVV
ncbi:MAG: hypothetical protein RJA52_157 [Bacteroidota bacterium]